MLLVTPKQMRLLEENSDRFGLSFGELMENAGEALANELKKLCKKEVGIFFLCGNGNNAGDCFVASRLLERDGYSVTLAMLCGAPKTDIAKNAFERCCADRILWEEKEIADFAAAGEYAVAVDGVFGTGFHGELPESIKVIFSSVKGIKAAVDVPSGGNSADGTVSDGTFQADITITFAYKKFGMEQYPLKSFCGRTILCDIGIDRLHERLLERKIYLTQRSDIEGIIPKKAPDSHKGCFGRLVCVCGSRRMSGAGLMSVMAAARCGTGLITAASAPENISAFCAKLPEVMYEPMLVDKDGFYTEENADRILKLTKKATAVLIGCGLGVTESANKLVKRLIREINCPIILDADGINCISDSIDIIREARSGIILTPHPAEMSRLIGKSVSDIQRDRLDAVSEISEKYGAVTVLKGAGTVISDGRKTFVNPTGNPGMAKGGSGDVLAGMTASFAAQGIEPLDAAVIGAFIHGLAGDRAAERLSMQAMLPTDMIAELPEIFKEMER